MSVSAGTTRIVAMNMENQNFSFDMEQRDPNNLNNHLQVYERQIYSNPSYIEIYPIIIRQVQWSDVIGEPESIRSNDCIWNCSYKVYIYSRLP